MRTNPVDIGVRVEVSAAVMEPLTTALYESKLIYYTPRFDDPVRTFCMNPYGAVSLENYGDVVTVNGHSYADFKTDRTNFALLVSTDFTEPFDDPIAYGKSIARLANVLGEDIIVQRLGDLHQGHRSTMDRIRRGTVQPTLQGATAGDLAFVLPYRHLTDILEMLAAMDKIAPGVNGRDTLLYGVEVKFYSARPELDDGLQTPVKNLYAVGDGAGITRGLIQASAAGVIAARSILGIEADGAPARETTAGKTGRASDLAAPAPAAGDPAAWPRRSTARGPAARRSPAGPAAFSTFARTVSACALRLRTAASAAGSPRWRIRRTANRSSRPTTRSPWTSLSARNTTCASSTSGPAPPASSMCRRTTPAARG